MARLRLGDMLLRAQLIDQTQLEQALAQQRQWGGRLGDALVSLGLLDEVTLWQGLSAQLNVALVHLPSLPIVLPVAMAIPTALCEQHLLIPIARDARRVTVATGDPTNIGAVDEVAFAVGCAITMVLAPPREVEWAIRRYHRGDPSPCPPPRMRGAPPAPTDELELEELIIRDAGDNHVPQLRGLVEACVAKGLFTTQELAKRWGR